ncbi:MAG TPA: ATP-binding cassette domain-containing protein, partial [Clostridia bacterium]|nr:ATP-binding cassette domain-containing protein [Clostridia bacterium]
GSIDASVEFDYFPPPVPDPDEMALRVARRAVAPFDAWEAEMEACLARGDEDGLARYGTLLEHMLQYDGYQIDEFIARETGKLGLDPGALERPFYTLSHGERAKLLIAALFLRKNAFLLIDEPTDHLDMEGRAALQDYLAGKQGFLLVSHDRTLLDGVADHVLSINRADMELQRGNYSSWRQNREMQDKFERERNQTLRGEIGRLTVAMRRTADWSDQIEAGKIGTHVADRGAVGARSARMMKRAKAVERRIGNAIEEKQSLLLNLETAEALRLQPLPYPKKVLAEASDLQVDYGQGPLFEPLSLTLRQGQRLALLGPNGSGKSSLLRMMAGAEVPHIGRLRMGAGLILSYVRQDAAHLQGFPREYVLSQGVDLTLFLTLLRKLDFPREAFDRPMEDFSAG